MSDSPVAQSLFEKAGGDSSVFAARFLAERDRGEIGLLAMNVAQCADIDRLAAEILADAGTELARLASAMLQRYGSRKVAVGGRAAHLHPSIETAMRRNLPNDIAMQFQSVNAHAAAARLALKRLTSWL